MLSARRGYKAHDPLDEEALMIEDSLDDGPYKNTEIKDRNEVLRQCIEKLSRSHREILDLEHFPIKCDNPSY
jgi:hypothetical protein